MLHAVQHTDEDNRNHRGYDHLGEHITAVVAEGIKPHGRTLRRVAVPDENSGKEAAEKAQERNGDRAYRDANSPVLNGFPKNEAAPSTVNART